MLKKQVFQKNVDTLDFLRRKIAFVMGYGRQIALLLLGIAAAAIVFFSYEWYKAQRDRAAQRAFSALLVDMQEALANNDADLGNLLDKIRAEYQQYKNTVYGPYIHMVEVDLLLQKGSVITGDRLTDYGNALHESLEELKDTPLYYLAKTKLILIMLDSLYEEVRTAQEADVDDNAPAAMIAQLADIAYDQHNQYRDYALYYLGRYYFVVGNMVEAKRAWQDLIDMQRIEKAHRSPWATLAEEKIAQIV